ncbi:MAG: SAM-dependent methyltransferase [Clostridia bacterium]|jgi:2-polyprenyl-3-methyl-5-hydroxy-6-metoxy-1,4-benzoquinol methylase|nr:SAM-dependent methyltransferase [Clostridia bacterium]
MDNYYNNNAKEFFDGTVDANMNEHYTAFLEKLPQGAHILDAGCGSGRDSLNFKKLGYQVTAIDASDELCKLARTYIGQEVLKLRFQNITFENHFDGIWACASLLHVPSTELRNVIGKLAKALKPEGILFASFKYGTFEGERNGRYFHDLTEEKAEKLFVAEGLKVEEMWITKDVRLERVDEFWLNIITINIRKITAEEI